MANPITIEPQGNSKFLAGDKLLKAADVASILQISRTQAYRLMRDSLPAVRLGPGVVRVRQSALERFVLESEGKHE